MAGGMACGPKRPAPRPDLVFGRLDRRPARQPYRGALDPAGETGKVMGLYVADDDDNVRMRQVRIGVSLPERPYFWEDHCLPRPLIWVSRTICIVESTI